jgi:peptidoglycan/xylan/chitin deacetylase (PgdA/CDA1 family)
MNIRRVPAAVILLAGIFFFAGCSSITRSRTETQIPEGQVILTFDDGPNAHADTTARLLDVLKKYEVKTMFALLGENAEHNPQLVRRIAAEGHIIINHGYSDSFAVFMDKEEFAENLRRGENAIALALGKEYLPKLYRPQGGFYRSSQREVWEALRYTLVPATARAYDAVKTETDKDAVARRIVEIVEEQRGGIILLHDARDSHVLAEKERAKNPQGVFNRSWIPSAVEEIIVILRGKGFYFAAWF